MMTTTMASGDASQSSLDGSGSPSQHLNGSDSDAGAPEVVFDSDAMEAMERSEETCAVDKRGPPAVDQPPARMALDAAGADDAIAGAPVASIPAEAEPEVVAEAATALTTEVVADALAREAVGEDSPADLRDIDTPSSDPAPSRTLRPIMPVHL
jgi:hypothetical protein